MGYELVEHTKADMECEKVDFGWQPEQDTRDQGRLTRLATGSTGTGYTVNTEKGCKQNRDHCNVGCHLRL